MPEDIKWIMSECQQCEEDAAAQSKEPQLAHSIPKYPWSKVWNDLCRCKRKDWGVIVDYLTDFIVVLELQQTLTTTVIKAIKKLFAKHGVPVLVGLSLCHRNSEHFKDMGVCSYRLLSLS